MSGWPCWPAISQTCLTWGNTQNNTLTKISWQNYNFNYYQLMRTIPQMNVLMAVQWTFIGVILLTYRIIVESPTIVSISAPPPLERINISLVFENIFHVSSLLCPFYLLRQKEHYSHFPEVHIYSIHCTLPNICNWCSCMYCTVCRVRQQSSPLIRKHAKGTGGFA